MITFKGLSSKFQLRNCARAYQVFISLLYNTLDEFSLYLNYTRNLKF